MYSKYIFLNLKPLRFSCGRRNTQHLCSFLAESTGFLCLTSNASRVACHICNVSENIIRSKSLSSTAKKYEVEGMIQDSMVSSKTNDAESIFSLDEPCSYEPPRTSVLIELTDSVGVLQDALRYFWKYDVNICRIESRPKYDSNKLTKKFDFVLDIEGSLESDEKIQNALSAMRDSLSVNKILVLDAKEVHWFPRHISELDLISTRVLDAGVDLKADHPGFLDPVYRDRRAELAKHAIDYKFDRPIPRIEYTQEEKSLWEAVWDRMENLWEKYACKEYIQALQQMKYHCNYNRSNIPQQADISEYLRSQTGFRMRPVPGLLSSRDFLNALAFRVFCSTQYIRHSSQPLYTPEPDIIHELLGHAPMLADPDFADFSQEIGLASLGASNDEVAKLSRCYWFTVEFGLCKENGVPKAYGAGLLSSFGELEYACDPSHPSPNGDPKPELHPWDPDAASRLEFPITTYQPIYFIAESLMDAKYKMRRYCEDLPRPFFAFYNFQTNTVNIDRPVQRTKGDVPFPTLQRNDTSYQ